MRTLNIAMLGANFMGRAHSNAWSQVQKFFAPKFRPVLKVVCGLDPARTRDFAYLEKLKAAGVEGKLIVRHGMQHGWGDMEKEIAQFVEWFDAHLRAR